MMLFLLEAAGFAALAELQGLKQYAGTKLEMQPESDEVGLSKAERKSNCLETKLGSGEARCLDISWIEACNPDENLWDKFVGPPGS